MILIAILLGTLTAGIGSVWFAAFLSFGILARYTQHMLSLAAGALLATAFMHLLPEAFESQAGPQTLFAALLAGLVFFFLLDKAELWHHGHEHHDGGSPSDGDGDGHGHNHIHHHDHARERSAGPTQAGSTISGDSAVREATGVGAGAAQGRPEQATAPLGGSVVREAASVGAGAAKGRPEQATAPSGGSVVREAASVGAGAAKGRPEQATAPSGGSVVREATSVGANRKSGGWSVMAGDSVHAFGDGILIASAFMADLRLGVVASLAVLVHEVPHHMGDLVVMRQTSNNRRAALIKVTLAGAVTALGGIVGYALVDQLYGYLPFFLVLAASSFIYVALADLIPQLQRRVSAGETAAQIAWLGIGIGLVTLVSKAAHR
jgi:zinc transporter ZupT